MQQFEQGIVFRFGRIQSPPRGAGLTMIRPVGDRMQMVNMQIVAMVMPAQDGITRDNVTVRVDAVVYFRVVDPIKATAGRYFGMRHVVIHRVSRPRAWEGRGAGAGPAA